MPPPGKGKYFLAVIPPSPVKEEIQQWKEYFSKHFKTAAALRSPAHLTLHMPFEWPEKKEDLLQDDLTRFCRTEPSFELPLEGFGCFAPRVIFINVKPNAELTNLQARLRRFCRTELQLFNDSYRDLPFHPHITVAFRDLKKSVFASAWESVKAHPFTATSLIRNVSLLKHNGHVWETLSHHPLMSTK